MAESHELLRLTPTFREVEGGWVQAQFVELPGVVTAAPTHAEAEEQLIDALREFLLSFGPGELPSSADPTMTVSLRAG